MAEGLLLGLALIGIFLTIFSRFIKTGLVATLVGAAGFVFVTDINSWIPIIFLILGLLCIVLEIFIPDFGVLGIIGIAMLIGGLYFTSGDLAAAITDFSVAAIVAGAIIFFLIKSGLATTKTSGLVLSTSSKDKKERVERENDYPLELGQRGIVSAPLRPTGRAKFTFEDGTTREVEVASENEALDVGTHVEVVSISGNKIMIRSV